MSIQAVAWALDQDLPARVKLVLVAIANHADHTNGYCWLKAETIAREASCGQRSVWRYVGALIRNGYVRKSPRKAEDGRQRANDYWIMFGREPKPWAWGRADESDLEDLDDNPVEDGGMAQEPEPCAMESPGPEVKPCATGVTRPGAEVPQVAHGPCATGVTRIESAEPSKTNPKKDSGAGATPVPDGLVSGPPRNYRPPPPLPEEPMGAIIADREAKQIFVFEGSRAWKAWVDYKLRVERIRWTLVRVCMVNGARRSGWWFPSLFPPDHKSAADKVDQEFIAKHGLG
jgi:hypothetical protein